MKSILFLLLGNIRYDGRVQKEIQSLIKVGHKVTLLVSSFDKDDKFENYNYDIIVLRKKNTSNLFSKLFSLLAFYPQVRKTINSLNPDIIHCNDLNTLIFTSGLSKKFEIIYDAHELYVESRKGLARFFWKIVERCNIYKTKAVIVPQIDRLYYLSFQYSLPLSHYHLVENFPLKKSHLSTTFFKDKYGIDTTGKKIINYIGAITKERELLPLVKAMNSISDAILIIIGKGDVNYEDQLKKCIIQNNLQNKVLFFPPIAHNEVLEAVNSSDIGVCFYNDKNLNSFFCASNKLYEYLDLGVKVLTNYTVGASHIIEDGVNGYCCKEVNETAIAEGLNKLLSSEPIKPANYYWDNQIYTFTKLYE